MDVHLFVSFRSNATSIHSQSSILVVVLWNLTSIIKFTRWFLSPDEFFLSRCSSKQRTLESIWNTFNSRPSVRSKKLITKWTTFSFILDSFIWSFIYFIFVLNQSILVRNKFIKDLSKCKKKRKKISKPKKLFLAFRQTRTFDCLTNLSPWIGHVFTQNPNHFEHRPLIQELITNILDLCAPLLQLNVTMKIRIFSRWILRKFSSESEWIHRVVSCFSSLSICSVVASTFSHQPKRINENINSSSSSMEFDLFRSF